MSILPGISNNAKDIKDNIMYDLEFIKQSLRLSEKRYRHSLGTEKAALGLARRHYPFLDENTVSAAALLHDCTKELTYEGHIAIFEKYSIEIPEGGEAAKKFFHAKTGAAIAEQVYGLTPDAVSAIAYHTTGRKDMTPFEKVIYFADYIEENRDDKICTAVRNKYFELADKYPPDVSLDMALLYAFDRTLKILVKEMKFIHHDTIDGRNSLIISLGELKTEIGE